MFEPLRCLFNVTNGPFCLHLLGGKREREVARSGLVPQPQMASDGINNSNNKTGSNINRQNIEQIWRSRPVPQPQLASDGINNSNNKTGSNINRQNMFGGLNHI